MRCGSASGNRQRRDRRRRPRGCAAPPCRRAARPLRRRSTAQPAAAAAAVRARQRIEALEHARQRVVGNARAAIGDLDPQAVVVARPMRSSISPPGGEKSAALSIRLTSAWRSRNASPRTARQRPARARAAATARLRQPRRALLRGFAARASPASTGSGCSSRCRCSTAASASSLSIICARRSLWLRMLAAKRARSASGIGCVAACSSSSALPRIAASGLFISWVSAVHVLLDVLLAFQPRAHGLQRPAELAELAGRVAAASRARRR